MGRRRIRASALAAVAGVMLAGGLTAPAARADDPLAPITSAIQRDRTKACGDVQSYQYDKQLEAVAQAYARSNGAPPAPPGYFGVKYFKGSGDPEAHAINSAYTRGVGQVIADCTIKHYGVGFVRNGSTDVVAMAFGVTTPPPPVSTKDTTTHAGQTSGGPRVKVKPITNPVEVDKNGAPVPPSDGGGAQCTLGGVRCQYAEKVAVDENTGECVCRK